MEEASEGLDFEVAARYRDQLLAITRAVETRQQVESGREVDQDILAHHREGDRLTLQALFVRKGKLEGTRVFSFQDHEQADEEFYPSFLVQYYQGGALVPHEVIVPLDLPDRDAIEEILQDLRGAKVKLLCPTRGAAKDLLESATLNAQKSFRETQDKAEQAQDLLEKLQRRLGLQHLPARMECFDISNFQGKQVVGSMVVFEDGASAKHEYRHFKIKGFEGQNDFASLYEVLERRFKRTLDGDWPKPDLVIIDGGKGQLGQAVTLLSDLGIHDVDLISLAKSRVTSDVVSPNIERSTERVFVPGRKNPIVLRQNSAELYLLTRIRDEAHRFAITFHRAQRRKDTLKSTLEDIPSVGPARRKALLERFGSLDAVKDADVASLAQVEGVGEAVARQIFTFFNSEEALREQFSLPSVEELAELVEGDDG
jgi:excinuclease ABC subunit C